MTATIFLAAFLGCLLAFAMVTVALMQFTGFIVRRFLKRAMPEIMHMATGTTLHHQHEMFFQGPGGQMAREGLEVIDKLREAAKHTPPGVTPHLPTITCEKCKVTVDVPYEVELEPRMLELRWRCELDRGWLCGDCK